MSLSDRLRAEARTIPAAADPALVARIQIAVRSAPGVAAKARIIRWRPILAMAACLVLAATIGWLARPAAPGPPVAGRMAVPALPTLDVLVGTMPTASPLSGEIAALGKDLTAAAAAVRGAVPF